MAASCAPAASAVVGVGDAASFSDHHFRISSVAGYSGYHRILTIHDISTSAQFAHAVLAAEEADTDPLTDFPFGHSAAQGFNPANYFMPRNAWKNQTRVRAHNRGRIAVTDSACFHPNPNLTVPGSRMGRSSR